MLVNSIRQEKTKMVQQSFADNKAFVAHKHQDAVEIITHLSKSAKLFGLKIHPKKTEDMYEPPPESHDIRQEIQKKGHVLIQENKFKYLGSIVTKSKTRCRTKYTNFECFKCLW